MSTHTNHLFAWRPTRRTAAIISAAVLAAVVVVVMAFLLTRSDTTHSVHSGTQPTSHVKVRNAVYDCYPTRVVHPC